MKANRRACDEIEALRERQSWRATEDYAAWCAGYSDGLKTLEQARAEALEEAAQWIEQRGNHRAQQDAADIRALIPVSAGKRPTFGQV